MKRSVHEEFARFFESPTRDGLRKLLQAHYGELDTLDFKAAWPKWPKLARLILSLANCGGGCVVVGVSQAEDAPLDPVGLGTVVDKADIHKGVEGFLPADVRFEILEFSFEASEYPKIQGRTFQVLFVDDVPVSLPFLSRRDGEGIRGATVYVRRGTRSEPANHEELQRIISRRLDTGHSSTAALDLGMHLDQLKVLYAAISQYYVRNPFGSLMLQASAMFPREVNASYPDETFDEFVSSAIRDKKMLIRDLLELL